MLKHRVLSDQLGSQTTVFSGPSRCQDPRASPQLSEPYLKTQRERGLWGMKPPRGQAAINQECGKAKEAPSDLESQEPCGRLEESDGV